MAIQMRPLSAARRVVARRWAAGARIVPTAEWVGVDVDDEDKPAWVEKFAVPSLPKVIKKDPG